MKVITILGSTGSIGRKTLEVVHENMYDFEVYALTAFHRIDILYQQCLIFKPLYAVVVDKKLANKLSVKLSMVGSNTKVLHSEKSLITVSTAKQVDMVMAAIVGIAGLAPTYAAVNEGKVILLANKEALVTAGEIFMHAAKASNATILPVDSEHNAIFQCLPDKIKNYDCRVISKITLTASGGPFLNRSLHELKYITPDEACRHPNWQMGQKISIDSSTMMNKALEIIEAYWLFDIPVDRIEVVIHPQSIVHSMVEYQDGSCIAQMSFPDMKIPIGYSMYYPKRKKVNVPKLNLSSKTLTFLEVDNSRFSIIPLVYNILERKKYASIIVLNAVNEVLVQAFLAKKIQYLEILEYIELAVGQLSFDKPETIEDVIEIDYRARAYVADII